MSKRNLAVGRIAGCHARLEKIRKVGQQMTVPSSAGDKPAAGLAQQRQVAIAAQQSNCPHPLLMEVFHDPWPRPLPADSPV